MSTAPSDDAGATMQRLAAWIGAVAGATPVAVAPREAAPEPGRIEVRLAGIAPRAEPRALDRRVDRLAADYLVTWRLDDPVAEARLHSELAFALAAEEEGFELAGSPDLAAANTRTGAGSAAALLIRCDLLRARTLARAPRVREPAVTQLIPLASLDGVVLGPDNVPIAGATVCIANDSRMTTTDSRGRFRFAAPDDTPLRLDVRGRDAGATATVTPGTPATIHLPVET